MRPNRDNKAHIELRQASICSFFAEKEAIECANKKTTCHVMCSRQALRPQGAFVYNDVKLLFGTD